ncbi:MAG: DUF4395 domain-containing protein [Leptospiraceae bacterium]|nr:DUF4395 domain-containing protein [Leptospiraceae bacterium]
MNQKSIFAPEFPEQINENGARATAFFGFLFALVAIVFPNWGLVAFLVYEYLSRVLYGPSISVQSFLAGRLLGIIKPAPKWTAGAPKRFAQFVGTAFTVSALILLLLGQTLAAQSVLGVLAFFSFLEFSIGFCAACFLFAQAIRFGLISRDYCDTCVVRYDRAADAS